jgi:ribosomal protein S18 acetylase RimI-like enzyme
MSEACQTTTSFATLADTAELASLVNLAYRPQTTTSGWTNETELLAGARADEASIRILLMQEDGVILVLRRKSDSELLGCVLLTSIRDTVCHLSLLAVHSRHQNLGAGRILLREAEQLARSNGSQTARITVIQQRETLIEWYERRGYSRTGEAKPFPYDDASVGMPLRDDLRLLVMEKGLLQASRDEDAEAVTR